MNFSLLSSYINTVPNGDDEAFVYEDVWTGYANSLLTQVFFYTAIALIVILVAVGIAVRYKRPEKFSGYVKGALLLAGGFAAAVLIAMLALGFAEIAEKGYADYTDILGYVYIPSIIMGAVVVLGIAASYVASLFGKKPFKITLITFAAVFGAALIALLVCLGIYFSSGNAESNNGAEISSNENIALYCSVVGVIAVIAILAWLMGRGEKKEFDSRSVSYAGICIAMSFALSYIKFFEMPQGGSLTLASLLPLMIYSYMFGVRKGVLAGFAYGILQAVQGIWFIHPAQFLLDYPVAFSAIGLAGMFSRVKALKKAPQVKFALGAIVASVIRFASHVFAGVFAFSEYSTLDNVWAYSLAYNSFVFADIAIAIVVGVIVFSSRAFNAQVNKVQFIAFANGKYSDKPQPAAENNAD
ncbi:MAG TPA: energy-coupled thiamine transporter ThiT [Candidatus Coproplasma excrementavium]|nr:energy-coupled thiamine transporter ThiT [Candidatus Coproplasma excrementavium]